MVIADAALKMIAAEITIFPIVDMDFSFLISWLGQSQRATTLRQRTACACSVNSRIPILDWPARPELRAIAAACTIPTG
jgi:hypothetical protein